MGYFIRQKTKQYTGWGGYLLTIRLEQNIQIAVLIVHAGWEQLCAEGKDDSYPFITKNVMMGLCPSTDEKLESLWLKLENGLYGLQK